MNVGPTAEGLFPQPSIDQLREIGGWMNKNGESIYGSTASPFFKLFWGRCTKKISGNDQILYLHVFDIPQDGQIMVPGLKNEVKNVRILSSGAVVPFEDQGEDILIDFSGQTADPYNTVLKIEIEGEPDVVSNMPQEQEGRIVLPAAYGFIHSRGYGQQAELSDLTKEAFVTNWVDPGARVEFMFSAEGGGTYRLWMEAGTAGEKARFKIEKETGPEEFFFQGTGDPGDFVERDLGTIHIDSPGVQVITIVPVDEDWSELNLKGIKLEKE